MVYQAMAGCDRGKNSYLIRYRETLRPCGGTVNFEHIAAHHWYHAYD
ncbi:MAG: hypothetical protein JWM76_1206 [Pseudonocardiales bacterium]|nr:hypothetical protein [Pseudonocardiales bacterium]